MNCVQAWFAPSLGAKPGIASAPCDPLRGPEAEAEARAAFLWYFERSPLAADAFRTELFRAVDGLVSTAADWPRDEDGTHRYHLQHFPYTLVYETEGTAATVLAIAHQRRRPRYWQT